MQQFLPALCTLAIAGPALCAPITYDVNLSGTRSDVYGLSGSVVGMITTDGVQGLIEHADILDFSTVVTLGAHAATLTPADGEVLIYELPLIANQSGLFDSTSPGAYTTFVIASLPEPSTNYFDLSRPAVEPAELAIRVDGVLDFFHIPILP